MSSTTAASASFREGFRAAVPFAIAGGMLAISFGVVAQQAGFSALEAVLMSLLVFAGSAQFTAVAILAAGGGAGAAISAATLMNSRFLAMGAALGPSLPGGRLKRAAQGQTVVDASWAIASRGDGTFDRWTLFGASSVQWVTWQGGTALGAVSADIIGDPARLGLDALFPAFFLALLMAEARTSRARGVAALGGLIALALVPITPAGVPVLVAGLAALVGLTPAARAELEEAAE
jgi:4-azaleucine resistance transporter AzlC